MQLSRNRALAAAALLLLAGCASQSPVRVVPRGEWELYRDLDVCALQGDVPSARTIWALRLMELEEPFREDPIGTLRVLHERALQLGIRDVLFGLAELSYLAGKRLDDEGCFLAAAVYAYLFLLGDETGSTPSPYDRRFRWACDIYNRSLMRALQDEQGALRLEPGRRDLPAGLLDVSLDFTGFPFEREGLELLPADALDVIGLGFRVRDSGLGAPLIALVQRRGDGTAGVGILDRTSVSATLFLRVEGGLSGMREGLSAVLELHSTYDVKAVEVAEALVPLEADPSATIAYGLESSELWRVEFSGFFQGRDALRANGLILPRPYVPGRIPVVLVHGTASNPARWAELLNSLHADPLIRARVQFWLFVYTTGNPVAYSAASLRESLQVLVDEHDPRERDVSLRHMVVVGHSQGGLLAKMTAIHLEADDAALAILKTPLESLHLKEEELRVVRRCFDIEPLPFVDRLVFVATPHQGSFLADSWISRLLAKLIAVPGEIEGVARRIGSRVPVERLPPGMESAVPTSLDNMNPAHPFVRLLSDTPIDPRIHLHSIIPIGDAEDPAEADDGVVAYRSAHLEGVESEVLVPSKHSCQAHPRTIIELRRILHEHIRAVDALAGAPSGEPAVPERLSDP